MAIISSSKVPKVPPLRSFFPPEPTFSPQVFPVRYFCDACDVGEILYFPSVEVMSRGAAPCWFCSDEIEWRPA